MTGKGGWDELGLLSDGSDPTLTLFKSGECFHYSGRLLQGAGPELYTCQPGVVCLAFATEAYLKALLTLEGKEYKEIHNLYRLYYDLPITARNQISDWWNAECLPTLQSSQRLPGLSKKYVTPTNLSGCLRSSAKAFVNWRYNHLDYQQWSLMTFPAHVRRRILLLKPDWDIAGEHISHWIDSPSIHKPSSLKAKMTVFSLPELGW